MKLPEKEIYRMNLLVKECLIEITSFLLERTKSLYSELLPPRPRIFKFNVIKRLVYVWYQKKNKIMSNPDRLQQISQFPWLKEPLPYDLETIQFYIKEMSPLYCNSLVIQYINEIEIPPAQRQSFYLRYLHLL
ncbi:hypothetical protein [Rickettsiella massiliensis]|uniref:hypothetical protein n=1 Tax=Rickettsiella massiliensis TaxID=676517 RepID=UPI00029B0362|nr:hypothetical protein [Rickettsiella massiliensis]